MERKWWTLLAMCVATFMLLLDITIVNVALPDIQRSLDASFSDLQWVVDAYALMLAALLLTAGSLGDRLGRRRVFAIGFAIFTVASLLCGAGRRRDVPEPGARLQGVGGAVMFATSLALIAQEFQGRERATAFGIWGATVGGAVAIGPLVGGVLTESLGWEWIFFVNVPIGIAAIALTRARSRVARHRPGAGRLAGLRHLLGRAVPARLRARPGQRRGLGQRQIVAALIGVGGAVRGLRRDRAAHRRTRCSTWRCSASRVRRRVGGGVLPLGRDVRDVPLPDDLHPGRARLQAARGRRALPAADAAVVLRRPDLRPAARSGSEPRSSRRRAGARRDRPDADARR